MAKNLTETIFESKKNIYDEYRKIYKDTDGFDLERKHLFYGRIDPEGDVIYLDDSKLKQIYAGWLYQTEKWASWQRDYPLLTAVFINTPIPI